ncbi:MAG: symmetrical bis(5'-nucleosyl)-tetraphosphatase [Planctomycetes bacterium]|nr:symmetrical bis(5'-nucleosyl)-tetraphosphatase [Planctomycetota bacterium]
MATYVVGDLQGCNATLRSLLQTLAIDPGSDEVWLTGDLVNRGANSLDALRWAREHAQVTVLGNHDLHLLAVALGIRGQRPGDTLDAILDAPDRDELLDWLASQPLHRSAPAQAGAPAWLLVHAGLLPTWTLEEASRLATQASEALRADRRGFLEGLFDRKARRRDPLLAATRALTTLRCVDDQGELYADHKGEPSDRPDGTHPWFSAPTRAWAGQCRVLFGHWAALGLHVGEEAVGLDSGCVWGRGLSAYRLEDGALVTAPTEPEDLGPS